MEKIKRTEIKLIAVLLVLCLLGILAFYILISNIKVGLNINNQESQREIALKNTQNISNKQESNSENIIEIGEVTEQIEPTVCATLEIPKLNLKQSVLSEATDDTLEMSLGKLWGPDKPNEVGNYVIVGENRENGEMFGNLDKMVVGDTVKLSGESNDTLTYKVYDIYEENGNDLRSTAQKNKNKEVTLITSTKDGKKRLVVKAKEMI